MASSWRERCWQLGLVSALAIAELLAHSGNCARAQITPDSTLSVESSVVTPLNPGSLVDVISGGAIRGVNLFHSFREFNVSEGRGAYFYSPNAAIQNILARVTGSNPSEILGTLGTFGESNFNLFLINPNGIIFGPNASLNVGGSFVATTANAIGFGDQGVFSTSAPNHPPVLTVNPSAFLFNQIATQPITNHSTNGLQVPNGLSLLLLGGNVILDGGSLLAPGGRLELAGVAGAGTVGLEVDDNNLRLSFPDGMARADVSLTNGARVTVTAEVVSKGSGINITTGNLFVTNGAQLLALTRGRGDAGNVNINARDTVSFDGQGRDGLPSAAFSAVAAGAVGKGGSIDITTGTLSVTNGARLSVSTLGQGDAGSVKITARDTVSFDGQGRDGLPSAVVSTVGVGAVGKGGSIDITTGTLSITNGTQLLASTLGQGDAGSVKITARDTVSFDGEDRNGNNSAAYSIVEARAVGKGGGIDITTANLSVTNGAQLAASTRGQGDAGSVKITARNTVSFNGVGRDGFSSAAFSAVAAGAVGKGGSIDITTGTLSVTNGARLSASTLGQGDAGSIMIDAHDTVFFDGEDRDGNNSAAFSIVAAGAVGKGGSIDITTADLSVTNGAQLAASTLGQGDAGSVTITARDTVSFNGAGRDGVSSAAFSTVEVGAVGKGGGIDITTANLSVTNGAQLLARTRGRGDAGNVNINATDAVELRGTTPDGQFGSGLLADTEGAGNAGDIKILTKRLIVRDGAGIFVNSQGTGQGGNIQLRADSLTLDNRAFLSAETASATGGNIQMQLKDLLLLRNNSGISTNAIGTGGNINIDAKFLAALENSNITANSTNSQGGQVKITAQGIFGTQFRERLTPESDITASSDLGAEFSGTVELNTPEVDPSRGLVELPAQVVDPSGLIASGCAIEDGTTASQFVVTGRGGLPPKPDELLSSDVVWEDTRLPATTARQQRSDTVTAMPPSEETTAVKIVPATSWVFNDKGEVTLIASAPNATLHSFTSSPTNCRDR